MAIEYELNDGCTLHHYREDDWYVTVDADWWREHYLMCDEGTRLDVEVYREQWDEDPNWRECLHYNLPQHPRRRVEVEYPTYEDLRADFTRLERLGLADGPYGESDTYDAFTGNHENSFNHEMLILAGNVRMSQPDAWMTRDSDIVRALVTKWVREGGDLVDMYDTYIVAIGISDPYKSTRTTMDVYCDPNLDDAYDVARWELTGWACGLDVDVDGPSVYPRRNRPPMYDASACEWDTERNVQTINGEDVFPNVRGGNADGFIAGADEPEFMVVGAEGVWHIQRGEDGAWAWGRVWWMV